MSADNPYCITPLTCSTNRAKPVLRFMVLYDLNELFGENDDINCYFKLEWHSHLQCAHDIEEECHFLVISMNVQLEDMVKKIYMFIQPTEKQIESSFLSEKFINSASETEPTPLLNDDVLMQVIVGYDLKLQKPVFN